MTDIKWAEEKGDAVAKEWLESIRNPLGLGVRIKHALLEAERRTLDKCADLAENFDCETSMVHALTKSKIADAIRKLKGE